MLKYQVCLAVQHLNIRTILKKNENILFHQVPSKQQKKELCMKWIQSIKPTGNLPLGGGFFLCQGFFQPILKKKQQLIFGKKTFKTTWCIGGSSIPSFLNLENLEEKIHNCALSLNCLPFFRYTACILLLFWISPVCDSHFYESCFEKYLRIILLVLLCLFKFCQCLSKELNIPISFVIAPDKNPIKAIYLNIFTLGQNIELKTMITWVKFINVPIIS